MATITSKVIGVLYVVFGAAGFVLGDEADLYHNLLHLATGFVGVYVGFFGSPAWARRFCLAFGAGYLALGILGFVLGNPSQDYFLDVGLFSVGTFDHIHHLTLGTLIPAGVTLGQIDIRRRRRGQIRPGVSTAESGR
jgi:hypothetical protein